MEDKQEVFVLNEGDFNDLQTLANINYIANLTTRCEGQTINHELFLLEYGKLLAQLSEEKRLKFMKKDESC